MCSIELAFIPPHLRSGQSWKASIPERAKAAGCLFRLWKKSRAGIDHLCKDREPLASLTHSKFQAYCEKRLMPRLKLGLWNKERKKQVVKATTAFLDYREKIQRQKIFPYITSINRKWNALQYHLIAKAPRPYFQLGHFYLSIRAASQLSILRKTPPTTKKDVDALVRLLAMANGFIPWSYLRDGCSSKVRTAIDYLLLWGIPKTCLGKQFICIPKKFRAPGARNGWNYHVAIYVKLPNGDKWIIDPGLSKTRALTLTEWIDKQKLLPSSIYPMPMADLGHFDAKRYEEKELIYKTSVCTLLTTGPDISVVDQEFQENKLILGKTEASHETLEKLAVLRSKLEKQWLKV